MFTKENLENNSYLIYKMSPNLEIPLQVIFKERKIAAISSNYSVIREVNQTLIVKQLIILGSQQDKKYHSR